jgi:Second Messenger Oligonucleotide or Dinucleotide Synthetase domain
MATTIPSSFQLLRFNLEITTLQQSTVSTRQQNVRDAVARRMTVSSSFETGSYKRHAMIGPLKDADVDVFVVLVDPSYYDVNGYAGLLDRLRRVLLETYSQTPRISRNGQAVSITFTDFVVDVVPAFHRNGGGYLIPSTTQQRWISTDPTAHETYMTKANQDHAGDLVPLIKMIKAWNRTINRAFRSFYLELLVAHALQGVTISNDWSGCRYVFDKGRQLIRSRMANRPFRVTFLPLILLCNWDNLSATWKQQRLFSRRQQQRQVMTRSGTRAGLSDQQRFESIGTVPPGLGLESNMAAPRHWSRRQTEASLTTNFNNTIILNSTRDPEVSLTR